MSFLDTEIQQVMELRDQDLTFTEIGERLGLSRHAAQRRYKAGLLAEATDEFVERTFEDEDSGFPEVDDDFEVDRKSTYLKNELPEIIRFKPLVVESDDVMVVPDWHIPLFDAELANAMFKIAKKNKIKKLLIPGDYFNMDTFSHFRPHQPEADFAIEKRIGTQAMATALKTFDEVVFGWGNHDFRIAKFLKFKHSFTDCMKWALSALTDEEMSRIRFTDLDHFYLKTSERTWRICHQENFSSIPLSVAKDLAIKYNCSIMTSHSHHCAMGVAKDGRNLIIEAGGLFSKDHTEYIQRTNKHHEWAPGFVMIKNAVPHLFSPLFGNVQK